MPWPMPFNGSLIFSPTRRRAEVRDRALWAGVHRLGGSHSTSRCRLALRCGRDCRSTDSRPVQTLLRQDNRRCSARAGGLGSGERGGRSELCQESAGRAKLRSSDKGGSERLLSVAAFYSVHDRVCFICLMAAGAITQSWWPPLLGQMARRSGAARMCLRFATASRRRSKVSSQTCKLWRSLTTANTRGWGV